jgi:hypothetical protein
MCVYLSARKNISSKYINLLMDIAQGQGQIDKILVKFGRKLEEKLAEVCLALLGRVRAECIHFPSAL